MTDNHARAIEQEEADWRTIQKFALDNPALIRRCWPSGDGKGGGILLALCGEAGIDYWAANECPLSERQSLPQPVRTQVFERDLYRCRACGTHLNLTVDHIQPVSAGGGDELDNLQTLCRSCNSKKGAGDAARL
tara:strand:+ start:4059 stop:4460 length:402 start_codon:yes stop_codon:yes gene_type:complete